MGNRPKPTRLKILQGNRGKRPLNPDEPQLVQAIPDAPAYLSGEARAEWDRIMADPERRLVLTRVDGTAVAQYCELHADAVRIAGLKADPKFDPVREAAVMRQGFMVAQQLRVYCAEFGWTPASRAKIKVPQTPEKTRLESFLSHG